jgi:hypothetical protein
VPLETAADREALILDLQAEIALKRQKQRLGREFEVVVDGQASDEDAEALLAGLAEGVWAENVERNRLTEGRNSGDRVALGRSHHFGYDLDGVVALPQADLKPGDWVRARFVAATPYDIWALAC